MSTARSKVQIIRRVAQVWRILSIAFVMLFVISELFNPTGPLPTPIEWWGLAFFPTGVVMGLILAWWHEGIGGATAVLSLIAFYIWELVLSGDLADGPFFLLVATPGFLFAACWFLSRVERSVKHA